ncbi:MAG: hypothetical protein K6U02_11765 [Firmicutes bacterium]|nr:hypothetical protein [Bacillota bacterium]
MTGTTLWLSLFWQHAHVPAEKPLLIEYGVVAVACVVCAYALVRAVQWTVRPGEQNPDHIKRTILEEAPSAEPRSSSGTNSS